MASTYSITLNNMYFHYFLTFPACFWIPVIFPIWIPIVLIHNIWETSRNKLKKHSVTKNRIPQNCSDLSLFEQIVIVISKCLQIFSLQPRISKKKISTTSTIFLKVGHNNFGNKIPKRHDNHFSGNWVIGEPLVLKYLHDW